MSDPSLYEWIALRRVRDGGMAKSAGAYLDHGRPTPTYLTGVFDRLIWTGLVTVAVGDPIWDLRRLDLTDTGTARYTALDEQQRQRQSGLTVPAPKHGTQSQGDAR